MPIQDTVIVTEVYDQQTMAPSFQQFAWSGAIQKIMRRIITEIKILRLNACQDMVKQSRLHGILNCYHHTRILCEFHQIFDQNNSIFCRLSWLLALTLAYMYHKDGY